MPDHLGDLAKAEWNRLAELLESVKVLTLNDGPMLEATCMAYEQYRTFAAVVSSEGATYRAETANGFITRARPEVSMQSDAWRRYVNGLSHFGLTPATRSKVSVRREKSDQPDGKRQGGKLLQWRKKDDDE